MKKYLAALAAVATLTFSAGAASAVTFDFTTGSNPFVDSETGITATVTAQRNCFGWRDANVTQNGQGLGVGAERVLGNCLAFFDSPRFDGFVDERMDFAFSESVYLKSISFNNFGSRDRYRVYVGDGEGGITQLTGGGNGQANTNPYLFDFGGKTDFLRIQVTANSAAFRVAGIDAQVPLPAAGWMLLAGVGGLFAARRRKTRAAA